ncbi:MAG: outer membrane beta-barrel protein [Flavobacteriales bacterium]|nr:outer membrane beta-barrel protein [Flavobacteriales bacterium]
MKRSIFIFILLFTAAQCTAQKKGSLKTINLPKFDLRWYHFGMALGYNNSDFFMERNIDPTFSDSLVTLRGQSQPGFNINIVTAAHLGRGISIRFLPGISPKDRLLEYTFLNPDLSESVFKKRIESFYLEFPVFLKWRTDRINNFAAYLMVGGKYAIDMQSQKDVDNQLDEAIVIKTSEKEWAASYGGGFDFFLPYFKFGIELRHEVGMNNIFIDDNTRFSHPLQSLRSRNFVLSLTFEG